MARDTIVRAAFVDRGGAVYNVKSFEAVGDGVADDTTPIQNAIAAAAAAGGGKVLIPHGTYLISAALRLPDNVTLVGRGWATVLKLLPNSNCDVITNDDWENGNSNIHISNLYLDGARLDQTHVVGDGPGQSLISLVNVTHATVTNVWGKSARLHGIDLAPRSVSGNPDGDPGCSDIVISGCGFTDYGDDGITVHYSTMVTISQCVLWDSAASYSGSSNGIECDDGSSNITISGCLITNCIRGVMVQSHDNRPPSHHVSINNCIIRDCDGGIWLSSGAADASVVAEQVTVNGCVVRNCTELVGITHYQSVTISGCTFDGGSLLDTSSADATRTRNIVFANCVMRTGTATALNLNNFGPLTFRGCTWTGITAGNTVFIDQDHVTLDGCVVAQNTNTGGAVRVDTCAYPRIINCRINDNSNIGVEFRAGTDVLVQGCVIVGNAGTAQISFVSSTAAVSGAVVGNVIGASTDQRGIRAEAAQATGNVLIANNRLAGSVASVSLGAGADAGLRFGDNVGFATQASGTATVTAASTSVDVAHGLGLTPAIQEISVTPTNNLGTAAKFWISNPTSTQFTINVDVAPGAGTATFAWAAVAK